MTIVEHNAFVDLVTPALLSAMPSHRLRELPFEVGDQARASLAHSGMSSLIPVFEAFCCQPAQSFFWDLRLGARPESDRPGEVRERVDLTLVTTIRRRPVFADLQGSLVWSGYLLAAVRDKLETTGYEMTSLPVCRALSRVSGERSAPEIVLARFEIAMEPQREQRRQ